MSCDVIGWLHIACWSAQWECQNYWWTVEEVHHTRSMSLPWETLGSHNVGSHPHWCTDFPELGKHLDVHLDRLSHHTRLSGFQPKGMSASMMRSTKRCRRIVCLAERCMWKRLRSSWVLTVLRGCERDLASPHGIAPSLQCGFGVAGKYRYLSWLLLKDWCWTSDLNNLRGGVN